MRDSGGTPFRLLARLLDGQIDPAKFVARKDEPFSETQQRRNKRIAKTRARVEHTFAGLAQMNDKVLRSSSLAQLLEPPSICTRKEDRAFALPWYFAY